MTKYRIPFDQLVNIINDGLTNRKAIRTFGYHQPGQEPTLIATDEVIGNEEINIIDAAEHIFSLLVNFTDDARTTILHSLPFCYHCGKQFTKNYDYCKCNDDS